MWRSGHLAGIRRPRPASGARCFQGKGRRAHEAKVGSERATQNGYDAVHLRISAVRRAVSSVGLSEHGRMTPNRIRKACYW